MENNTITRESIERIFKNLDLNYTAADYYDDDLNYFIQVDGSKIISGTGMLDILIYFSTSYPKCTVMIGNLYRFKEHEGDKALEISNRINAKLNSGKVVVFEMPKQLIYIDSRVCNSFLKIDEEFISSIISSIYTSIAVIYTDIKVIENEK